MGTSVILERTSTSRLLYSARPNKKTASNSVAENGCRKSHIISSKPQTINSAIIHAGADGDPPRAAASTALRAWDTAYAISLSNFFHARLHCAGESITSSSFAPGHSPGKPSSSSSSVAPARESDAATSFVTRFAFSPPDSSTTSEPAVAANPLSAASTTSCDAASSASARGANHAAGSPPRRVGLAPMSDMSDMSDTAATWPAATSPRQAGSRHTARSPSTLTASRRARAFAAATSSFARHVLGKP
jgi:hypothetical protein|eukprot:29419-Pelagococcus_subviridis.AAC.2